MEVVNEDGAYKETRRYLPNAIQTRHSTGVVDTRYLHKDHLGSIDTITNKDGKIIEKVYFDVWGKRESIDSSQWNTTARSQEANTLVSVLDITPRGFTGHEHVDHADIIHMNGRIYDPTLGRFLQADPFIQAPNNSQSLNRYSYIFNNPLSGIDPSGYFGMFKKIGRNIIRAASKIFGKELVNIAGTIVATYFGGPLAAGAWQYEFARAHGASSEGAFFAAFTATAAAVVFQQIGQNFGRMSNANVSGARALGRLAEQAGLDGALHAQVALGEFVKFGGNYLTSGQVAAQIASHAVAGGVISVVSGGKFGHGFFSAGVTKGLGGAYLPGGSDLSAGQVVGGTVVSAVIGGTASVVSGGKFANGARTATYQYLFNQADAWYERLTGQFELSLTFAIGDFGGQGALGLSVDKNGLYFHGTLAGFESGSGGFLAVEAGFVPGFDNDGFISRDQFTGSAVTRIDKAALAVGAGGSVETETAKDGFSVSGGKIDIGIGAMDIQGTAHTGFLRLIKFSK